MWHNTCPWDAGNWNWLWFTYQLFWLILIVGGGYLLYRLLKGNPSAPTPGPYSHFTTGRCPECKAPVEAAFLRCPECGTRLKRNCPECGKIVKTRWQVCPYCEARLTETTEKE